MSTVNVLGDSLVIAGITFPPSGESDRFRISFPESYSGQDSNSGARGSLLAQHLHDRAYDESRDERRPVVELHRSHRSPAITTMSSTAGLTTWNVFNQTGAFNTAVYQANPVSGYADLNGISWRAACPVSCLLFSSFNYS